jgi:hypothetical protein
MSEITLPEPSETTMPLEATLEYEEQSKEENNQEHRAGTHEVVGSRRAQMPGIS